MKPQIRARFLDILKAGYVIPPLPNHDVQLYEPDLQAHRNWLNLYFERAQCIEASNVARFFEDTYIGQDKAGADAFWKDLKSLVPPFDSFFVEWERPNIPTALRAGVLFLACRPWEADHVARHILGDAANMTPKKIAEFSLKNPKWIYLTLDFLEFPNNKEEHISGLRGPYHLGVVGVMEDGSYTDFWFSDMTGAISKDESNQIGGATLVGWTALAMLNCQNIDTVKHDAPEAFQKARARRNKLPLVSYRTIKVNLEKTPRSIGSAALPEVDAEGRPVRLHQKRGHIKNYNKGNGLFGKYKGIWYWGPQLAGSGSEGVVVSDYEVSP